MERRVQRGKVVMLWLLHLPELPTQEHKACPTCLLLPACAALRCPALPCAALPCALQVKVLRCIKPAQQQHVVLGQYTAAEGQPGYTGARPCCCCRLPSRLSCSSLSFAVSDAKQAVNDKAN